MEPQKEEFEKTIRNIALGKDPLERKLNRITAVKFANYGITESERNEIIIIWLCRLCVMQRDSPSRVNELIIEYLENIIKADIPLHEKITKLLTAEYGDFDLCEPNTKTKVMANWIAKIPEMQHEKKITNCSININHHEYIPDPSLPEFLVLCHLRHEKNTEAGNKQVYCQKVNANSYGEAESTVKKIWEKMNCIADIFQIIGYK